MGGYTQRYTCLCIKKGSDDRRCGDVSLTVRGKVTRQRPSITKHEEKGEPKRRIESDARTVRLPAQTSGPTNRLTYDPPPSPR